MKVADFPATVAAAKELPKDSGSMVFLRFFNKNREISLKYRSLVQECLSYYNGVILGEAFAERDMKAAERAE